MNLKTRDLVRPEIFVLLFLLFISLGAISNWAMEDLGHDISCALPVYTILGLLAFLVGSRFVLEISTKVLLPIFILFSFVMCYNEFGYYSVPIISCILVIYHKWNILEENCETVSAIGAILVLANLLTVGALPALEANLRFGSQTVLLLFGYGFSLVGINYLYLKDPRKGILYGVFVFLVVSLYGFRSYLLLLALSLAIQAIMLERANLKRLVPVAAIAAIFVVFGGSFIISSLDQDWHLSPISLLFYRMGFTTHMFDLACDAAGIWGSLHGQIWTLPSTSPLIGEILVGEGNITTTIMGPLILDGGVLELPVMAFIGASINSLYRFSGRFSNYIPLYAIFFSILLISIEISPLPIYIFTLLFMLLLINRKNNK